MKTSRTKIVYNYLYEQIVSYKLKPGDPIIEQDVSSLLGCSRTPVREAIRILTAEGLVRNIPARGAYVLEISLQDIEEIFSLRKMLELGALKEGLLRISDEEIQNVEAMLAGLDQHSEFDAFFKSDRLLHDMIVRNSGNKRLMKFLGMINAQVERVRRISALRPQRLLNSKKEHLEIIEAIKARNLERASKFLDEHIENVKLSCFDVLRTLPHQEIERSYTHEVNV